MNSREKQIITGLYDREDDRKRGICINVIFKGEYTYDAVGNRIFRKTGYADSVEKAVRYYFSGSKFADIEFDVIYATFETEFLMYLLNKSLDKMLEIDQLKQWLFKTACNFAANKYYRKKVTDALGVDEDTTFVTFGFNEDKDEDSLEQDEVRELDEDNPESGIGQCMKIPGDDDDDPVQEYDGSTDMLYRYINDIQHDYYRRILKAIMIDNISREEFAAANNKKISAIYNDLSRAMDSLILAALPDIRRKTGKLFATYGHLIADEADYSILKSFYMSRDSIESIAKSFGIKEKNLRVKIAASYKELQKLAAKDPVEYECDTESMSI